MMNAISNNDHRYYESVSEETVISYLTRHPEFFLNHEGLLGKLKVPHKRGTAVSLVERQVTVLRDENQQLQRKLDNLVATAQRNEALYKRIQQAALRLAAASDSSVFFDTLYEIMREEFYAEAVSLRVFQVATESERAEFAQFDAEVFALFGPMLEQERPICGRLSLDQHDYLFPEEKIGSAVLLPIGKPKAHGILALGSRDVARFHASMGTDLLKHLADLIGSLMETCLAREAKARSKPVSMTQAA